MNEDDGRCAAAGRRGKPVEALPGTIAVGDVAMARALSIGVEAALDKVAHDGRQRRHRDAVVICEVQSGLVHTAKNGCHGRSSSQ